MNPICPICGPECKCEKPKTCMVCLQTSGALNYHQECLICVYCGHEVQIDIVERLAYQEDKDNPNRDYKLTVYHRPCHDKKLKEDFDKRPLTITQGHLDMVNRILACSGFKTDGNEITPITSDDVSTETNQQKIEIAVHALMVDMPLEQKFLFMKMMQSAAAISSIVLSRDPKARDITLEISKRDLERFQKIQNEKQERAEKKEQKAIKSMADIERANMLEAERKDSTGLLKAERKAIEGLMKIGMSEQQAKEFMNNQKGKVQ